MRYCTYAENVICDGFVKSHSAVLRFIPALLNSRCTRRQGRLKIPAAERTGNLRPQAAGLALAVSVQQGESLQRTSMYASFLKIRAPCIMNFLLCRPKSGKYYIIFILCTLHDLHGKILNFLRSCQLIDEMIIRGGKISCRKQKSCAQSVLQASLRKY